MVVGIPHSLTASLPWCLPGCFPMDGSTPNIDAPNSFFPGDLPCISGCSSSLHVVTDSQPPRDQEACSSSPDSLFDADSPASSDRHDARFHDLHSHLISSEEFIPLFPAFRVAPPIPGLFLPPIRLDTHHASSLLSTLNGTYFPISTPASNQVMLFGTSMFHPALLSLLSLLSTLLRPPALSQAVYQLLFPDDADSRGHERQAILNMYRPGEGITPHVDLLERYGDGIIGVSLGSGCAMRFRRVAGALLQSGLEKPTEGEGSANAEVQDVFLPENSVVVLSGEARYGWTHGIEKTKRDWVAKEMETETNAETEGREAEWIERDVRVSVTFRWLLPGAMVVGEPE